MSILNIIQLNETQLFDKNTLLRKRSLEVTDFDSIFQKEVDNLLDTFYSWKIAVGISAPQVGILKRFSIVNLNKNIIENTLILVNPILLSESGKKDIKKESCLSIPKYRGEVIRRYKTHISFQDRYGNKSELKSDGFLARVIKHEIDHLDGILFVDRMSSSSKLEPLDFAWE